jgi:phage-related protein
MRRWARGWGRGAPRAAARAVAGRRGTPRRRCGPQGARASRENKCSRLRARHPLIRLLEIAPRHGRSRSRIELACTPCIFFDTVSVARRSPLQVVFYRTERGSEPVREWLRGLPGEDRRVIGADLARFQCGWPVGRPLAAPLGASLFELRSSLPTGRIARVLFCFSEERIVALHGFIKKTQKTPAHDLGLARLRKREWEAADG